MPSPARARVAVARQLSAIASRTASSSSTTTTVSATPAGCQRAGRLTTDLSDKINRGRVAYSGAWSSPPRRKRSSRACIRASATGWRRRTAAAASAAIAGSARGGGGGLTRVLGDGAVFEKAGVNTSAVHGELRPEFAATLPGDGLALLRRRRLARPAPEEPARADGARQLPLPAARRRALVRRRRRSDALLSRARGRRALPSHLEDRLRSPRSPASTRASRSGATSTSICRIASETRGVGGIFFDQLQRDPARDFAFVRDAGDAFLEAYLPIVRRRKPRAWSERERQFQLLAPRPLRRVQPALRSRHHVRPQDRRAHRVDPDVAAAAGALGVRRAPSRPARARPTSPTGCVRATGSAAVRR